MNRSSTRMKCHDTANSDAGTRGYMAVSTLVRSRLFGRWRGSRGEVNEKRMVENPWFSELHIVDSTDVWVMKKTGNQNLMNIVTEEELS